MKAFPETIAVVRLDRLGDVIHTLPVAAAIKAQSPETNVVFVVRSYTAPVVRMCADVDSVVIVDDGKIASIRRALRGAEVALFPSPSLAQAMPARLARITSVSTGYRWYSSLFSKKLYEHRKTAERHEAEYNVRMLAPMGFSVDNIPLPSLVVPDSSRESVAQWIADNAISSYCVLHTGSGGSSPNWPEQNWTELGRALALRLSQSVVLTGLEEDRERLLRVRESLGETVHAHLFFGRSLEDLSALLSMASLAVSSSTGPGHLAAALGTPAVGLFPLVTPLSRNRWGLRGNAVRNLQPAEQPRKECPTCKECICLENMAVQEVLAAAEEVMQHR